MPNTIKLGRWAVVLACALTLAACSQAPGGPTRETSDSPTLTPAPVAESFAKYDALRTELIAALEQELPGITWSEDKPASMSKAGDGLCILQPASVKSSADIVEPSRKFEDVFAAGNPVLGKHGFPEFGGTDDVPGGWVVARSTDAVGATVSIESKSPAYLRITVPVTSAACDSSELPTDAG
ncbi:hypothetical protein [Paenarthrobacter sp. JL.01a]|uniref:hypothetical protein n=1 Tax=Paenarthrobacter sp. JL.01a TaxID=2979324 RepID=UPI0021C69122|nr:hypothetical protein [Paenarthrobacter sp. JL.01a]UXM91125.1 hypothetical protein N5P29_17780 [Paenarthrobacter sp. JL.01a]